MRSKNQSKKAEELWAKNKYLVLSKSYKYYLSIRNYLKLDEVDLKTVEDFITRSKDLRESPKDVINATSIYGATLKIRRLVKKKKDS